MNIKISILGCDAVLFGTQVPKFHRFVCFAFL